MKKLFLVFIIFLNTLSSCTAKYSLQRENVADHVEHQRAQANMVIYIDKSEQIFIEKPLLNVKNGIQQPFSKKEFQETLTGFSSKKKLIVVTMGDFWKSGNVDKRSRLINDLENLLKNHFKKVVFHQEQINSYTKILKE